MPFAITSVVESLCLPIGLGLLVLTSWMRRGRSAASRFWVREWTIWDPRPRLDAEMFFLIWLPVLALWLVGLGVAGILMLLDIGPTNLDVIVGFGGGLLALGVIVVLMLASGITITSAPGQTNLLRPGLYPVWLRETRRAERRHLRGPRSSPEH